MNPSGISHVVVSEEAAVTHPLPRLVALTALVSGIAGIGVELAARLVLASSGAEWLVRPVLYWGLPKPTVHTNWNYMLAMAGLFALGLFLALLSRSASTYPAPWIRVGLGLVVGCSAAQAITGIGLRTTNNLFVAIWGTSRNVFSPFDVAILIGFLLILPEIVLPGSRLLRNPKAPLVIRDLFKRG